MKKHHRRRSYGTIGPGTIAATGVGLILNNTLVPMFPMRIGNQNFSPLIQTSINIALVGNVVRKMPNGMIKTIAKAGLVIAATLGGIALIRPFLGALTDQT